MADFDGWTGSRHSFWPRSFTKNALQFVVRVAGYPRTPGLPRSALASTPESDSLRVYFTYPGQPLTARDSTGLDLTRAALASANELANEAGVKLVVAFAPTKFRVLQPFARFDPGSLTAGRRFALESHWQQGRGRGAGECDSRHAGHRLRRATLNREEALRRRIWPIPSARLTFQEIHAPQPGTSEVSP